MDWKSLIGYALIGIAAVYVLDKFKELFDLLTDIRDSLANIESHFVGEGED